MDSKGLGFQKRLSAGRGNGSHGVTVGTEDFKGYQSSFINELPSHLTRHQVSPSHAFWVVGWIVARHGLKRRQKDRSIIASNLRDLRVLRARISYLRLSLRVNSCSKAAPIRVSVQYELSKASRPCLLAT